MTFERIKGRLEVAINLQDSFFHSLQEALILHVEESMGEGAVEQPILFIKSLQEEIRNNESLYGGLLHTSK